MHVHVISTALLLGAFAGGADAQGRSAANPPSRSLLHARPQADDASGVASQIAKAVPVDPARLSNIRSVIEAAGVIPADESGAHALGACDNCFGAPLEGELGCGVPTDHFNGGCNSVPPVYGAITLGGSVCGDLAHNGTIRDTDWYQFTLTTTTTVQWIVRGRGIIMQAALMDMACPPTFFSDSLGSPCGAAVVTETLPPGTYAAFAANVHSGTVSCGGNNRYHATLIGVPSCSHDDGVSEDSIGLGNSGGGEQLYLHKMGGVGELAQVNSISMAWGTPAFPGACVPDGTAAQIRIFKDPDDDGIPDDLVHLKTKSFTTAGADTGALQTVTFDAPVAVSGVHFIGVSVVSAAGQFPLAVDNTTPSANRGWFTAEANGSGGVLDYGNFLNNDFFGENSAIGIPGVYLLRADCQPLEGACKYDDTVAETESAFGFAGEMLFLHRHGAVGEAAEVRAVSMSWGSAAIPGSSVPNGTAAQIRIFGDPDDDGIPDDAVLLRTQGLVTQDVDTDIFHETAFDPPVVVRGVYFVGVSVVTAAGQFPLGLDLTTPSANRAWFVGQSGGVINYGNLGANAFFDEMSNFSDGVHMLRADCHPMDEITAFCAPGVGGIVTCPCGNPQLPVGAMRGCNNFVGGGSGGAILAGTGSPTISGDTLAMNVSGGVNTSVTVLFQGTTNTPNTRTGAGVRCVGGALERLYKGDQVAGAIAFPNVANNFHLQSAAKGFAILPPITLYYYAAYRNQAANGRPGCPGLSFGFNSTNALAVIWTP